MAEENTAPEFKGEVLEVEFEGYSFKANTALLDDVEIVDLIDRIESGKSLSAIVEFLHYLIGKEEYEKMKAFYVQRDGKFKITQLAGIYKAIFAKFNPKG